MKEKWRKISKNICPLIEKKKKKIYQVHDKSIRKVLLNKREATIFINHALGLENTKNEVQEQEIELYNNQYVTRT